MICFQDGITITYDGHSEIIRGTLALVSGDNLASHCLGGFKSPSGAIRKCRHCLATYSDMQTKVCV